MKLTSLLATLPLSFDQSGRWRNPLNIIKGIDVIDILALPLYIVLILFITYIIVNRYYKNTLAGKYLMLGITAKLIASIAFATVYVYYYDGIGDTFYYFEGAKPVQEAWLHSPEMGIRVLAIEPGHFEPITFPYTSRISGFRRGEGEMVSTCKIVGTIMLLGFQSFWLTTVLIATFGFMGLWKMFRFFSELYPSLTNKIAWAVFFIPSALFWGSGILKDTICFGSLGWVVWSLYRIIIVRRNLTVNFFNLGLHSLIILSLKAYIIFAFIPAVGVWLFLRFKPKNESILLKYTLTPLIIIISFFGLFGIIQGLSKSSEKYSSDQLEKRAQGFHSYHGSLDEAGQSGYNLGNISYSPVGYLKKLPAAVNVTFFRPYIWEISDPFQLLSSIESFVFLFIFINTIYKVGPLKFIRTSFSNPEASLAFIFCLLFGFAVGFTAYNFGALVRFKIPALPFFIILMYIIQKVNRIPNPKQIANDRLIEKNNGRVL